MLCSNCGMEIPFEGNVCPWCRADKSRDQESERQGFRVGCVGMVLFAGWIIWSENHPDHKDHSEPVKNSPSQQVDLEPEVPKPRVDSRSNETSVITTVPS